MDLDHIQRSMFDAVRQPLTDCLNGCEGTLDAARTQCKAQTGCGGSACVDRCLSTYDACESACGKP